MKDHSWSLPPVGKRPLGDAPAGGSAISVRLGQTLRTGAPQSRVTMQQENQGLGDLRDLFRRDAGMNDTDRDRGFDGVRCVRSASAFV